MLAVETFGYNVKLFCIVTAGLCTGPATAAHQSSWQSGPRLGVTVLLQRARDIRPQSSPGDVLVKFLNELASR